MSAGEKGRPKFAFSVHKAARQPGKRGAGYSPPMRSTKSTYQWSPVAVSLRVHRVSLEAEWVGCFVQCKVKGESLWTLKVVFTSRHVANVPTAPSDRSFQRFPCPSTAPQQPDAAWKRTLACTNHPAALAVTPNMIQTSQGITQTKRNTAKHGPVGMHCLGKLQ
jgi:hypothetical protein